MTSALQIHFTELITGIQLSLKTLINLSDLIPGTPNCKAHLIRSSVPGSEGM